MQAQRPQRLAVAGEGVGRGRLVEPGAGGHLGLAVLARLDQADEVGAGQLEHRGAGAGAGVVPGAEAAGELGDEREVDGDRGAPLVGRGATDHHRQHHRGAERQQHHQAVGAEAALVGGHAGHRVHFGAEGGGGHRRVVEAGDAETQHQRGAGAAGEAHAEAAVAELLDQEEGGKRGAEGDHQREGDQRRVPMDVGFHLHRGHAEVVHRGDGEAEEAGGEEEAASARVGADDDGEGDHRAADRGDHREGDQRQVVGDRHRHLHRQHPDEVHRPDPEADRHPARADPGAPHHAGSAGAALRQIEREVARDDRHRDRKRDQTELLVGGYGRGHHLPPFRQVRRRS